MEELKLGTESKIDIRKQDLFSTATLDKFGKVIVKLVKGGK